MGACTVRVLQTIVTLRALEAVRTTGLRLLGPKTMLYTAHKALGLFEPQGTKVCHGNCEICTQAPLSLGGEGSIRGLGCRLVEFRV